MRGVVTPILGLIAVACIVFGVLNLTIWKPSSHIKATGTVKGSQYIVTDPGTLNMVDPTVTFTVAEQDAPDQDVCVAVGSAKDATGWTEGFDYARIKGLGAWDRLDVAEQKAQGEQRVSDSDVPFNQSNMWTQTVCGKGSATVTAENTNASQVIITDLGSADHTATVTMQWTRQTLPNYATPWFVVGGLFVVLAVLAASIFAMPAEKRRKFLPHRSHEKNPDEVSIGEAVTGTIAVLKPKKRTSTKPYKRHGRRNDGETTGSMPAVSGDGPKIVDTRSHNMLANTPSETEGESTTTIPLIDTLHNAPAVQDAGSANSAGDEDNAQTAVISDEELQAYFARFARETTGEDTGLLALNTEPVTTAEESEAKESETVEPDDKPADGPSDTNVPAEETVETTVGETAKVPADETADESADKSADKAADDPAPVEESVETAVEETAEVPDDDNKPADDNKTEDADKSAKPKVMLTNSARAKAARAKNYDKTGKIGKTAKNAKTGKGGKNAKKSGKGKKPKNHMQARQGGQNNRKQEAK